jgi:hypothetical protein
MTGAPSTNPDNGLTPEEAALGRIEAKLDTVLTFVSRIAGEVSDLGAIRQRVSDLVIDVARLKRDTEPAPSAPPAFNS